jgi:hypothetical protein
MKNIYILLSLCFFSIRVWSQQIKYSQPESEDMRTLDFEIIGKVSGNYLVYKNLRSKDEVSVYDDDMNLKENFDLDFIPGKTINTEFIAYPDFFYVIYQFQKRNILYCMAAALDGNGKVVRKPFDLDTTNISYFSNNKIYGVINSEDKSKILVYKIQKKNDEYSFTTSLFNVGLQLIHKSRTETSFQDNKDVFSDFFVDNEGNFVFTKGTRINSRDYQQQLMLVTKRPLADTFSIYEFNLSGNFLDELKLKIDNLNKQYLLNSLYYNKRNGNVEGLYTSVWDKENNKLVSQNFAPFNDSIKLAVKSEGGTRQAFNNFFIRNVILKNDGGFILTAEDRTTQSQGMPWNRYNYLYGYPYLSPYGSFYPYSPSSYWYSGQYQNYYNGAPVRYFYENIAVFNLDKTGNLVWSNVIHKSQYDDFTDNYLSYTLIPSGGQINFLYNELERHNELLKVQSISAEGNLTRQPPPRNLDRGYEFMPRYAKQVSYNQLIVPCTYRNYICFAKIEL